MIPRDDFHNAFDTYQALHITGFVPRSDHPNERICNADSIQPLFDSLNDKDKASGALREPIPPESTTSCQFFRVSS